MRLRVNSTPQATARPSGYKHADEKAQTNAADTQRSNTRAGSTIYSMSNRKRYEVMDLNATPAEINCKNQKCF
jgi:hypothetical protein